MRNKRVTYRITIEGTALVVNNDSSINVRVTRQWQCSAVLIGVGGCVAKVSLIRNKITVPVRTAENVEVLLVAVFFELSNVRELGGAWVGRTVITGVRDTVEVKVGASVGRADGVDAGAAI